MTRMPALSGNSARRWIPTALFLVLPGVLILSVLRPGTFLFGTDVHGGFYHLRGAVGKALSEGRLPVWDPHVMCGTPLLAAMHAGVLYPLTWLAAVVSPGLFWTLTAWIHLTLAGAFAFAWLHRGLGLARESALAGALLYMLSGFFASHVYAGHIPHVSAIPWVAAVLWRVERLLSAPSLRRGFLLAAATALMILAGFPHFVLVAALAVLARLTHYLLEEKGGRIARAKIAAQACAWLALAGLMAAPQLLPTLELIGQSQRASLNNFDFVSSYSLPPLHLLTLLAPRALGDPREGPTDSSGFVGLAGLALGVLGLLGRHRQRVLWAGLALLGVLLALGHYTPVFWAFFHVVPGAAFFRVPARYLLLFTLGAAPLAALGVERLRTGDDSLRRHASWIAGLGAILLLAALGFGGLSGSFLDRGLLWTSLSLAAIAGLHLAHGGSRLRGDAVALALGLLMVAELGGFNSRYFDRLAVEDMEWPPELVQAVRSNPQYPFRIATVSAPQTNAIGKCQLAGLDHVGGYDPMMLRRYTELVNVARGKAASELVVAMVLARPGPLFDLLGARLWIVPGEKREPPGWKTIGRLDSGFVYENPRALPRAFLVDRSVVIDSDEERLRFLAGGDFDASRVVVLESPAPPLPDAGGGGKGTVQLVSMDPGFYRLRTQSAVATTLVLAEAAYPGWTAAVDGAPSPIFRANHLLQAVRVPAGTHEVQFSYRSRFLGTGFGLAALGILAPLAILGLRRRKR